MSDFIARMENEWTAQRVKGLAWLAEHPEVALLADCTIHVQHDGEVGLQCQRECDAARLADLLGAAPMLVRNAEGPDWVRWGLRSSSGVLVTIVAPRDGAQ